MQATVFFRCGLQPRREVLLTESIWKACVVC